MTELDMPRQLVRREILCGDDGPRGILAWVFMLPVCWLRGHRWGPAKIIYDAERRYCWRCTRTEWLHYDRPFPRDMWESQR